MILLLIRHWVTLCCGRNRQFDWDHNALLLLSVHSRSSRNTQTAQTWWNGVDDNESVMDENELAMWGYELNGNKHRVTESEWAKGSVKRMKTSLKLVKIGLKWMETSPKWIETSLKWMKTGLKLVKIGLKWMETGPKCFETRLKRVKTSLELIKSEIN